MRVKAYAAYAAHLAELVAAATAALEVSAVPTDWEAMRRHLFQDKPIDFATGINQVWELGIPVLPLSDPVRMHGCCMRVRGRNVVILKQSIRYVSRWLFDLVHELHHACAEPMAMSFEHHASDPMAGGRREGDDEFAANEFAGNVLLNGLASELYAKVLEEADYEIPRLKAAALAVAENENQDIGILANYLAFRLKADHFVDWWGAAANLQAEGEDAVVIAREIFVRRFPFDRMGESDRELLEQALDEPKL